LVHRANSLVLPIQLTVCALPRGQPLLGNSRQRPHSYRFSQLLEREQVGRQRLAVRQLRRAITSFSIKEIQQAGASVPVGVLTDVSVLLCNLEIAGTKESDHLVVRPQSLVCVAHISESLTVGRLLLLLRLRNSEAGACDLALVAIKDWQRNAPINRSGVDSVHVGVVALNRNVLFADRSLQLILTAGSCYALLGGAEVRAVLQGFHLKILQVAHEGLIVERSGHVVIGGNGLVSQQLPQVG